MNPDKISTNYIGGDDMPWMPWTPLSPDVDLKYFKIDPVRGEIIGLLRSNRKGGFNRHRHTGPIMLYTIAGAWRYQEHEWIARAGDCVCETADSTHTFEAVGDEGVLAFFHHSGELHFLNDDDQVIYVENWRTALQRYREFCKANGIAERNVCSFEVE